VEETDLEAKAATEEGMAKTRRSRKRKIFWIWESIAIRGLLSSLMGEGKVRIAFLFYLLLVLLEGREEAGERGWGEGEEDGEEGKGRARV